MEDEILTLEEVSKYLKISERIVYDWAQHGHIPAGKIGKFWRFKKNEIEKWVNMRLSIPTMEPQFAEIRIDTVLSPDRVIFLDYQSKRDALVALAQNLSGAPQVKNGQELIQEILKRDDLMSTAIGRGIAIPHVRLASVTDLVVSVGISRNPLNDFEALDDEPVRILFMIAAAYNQHAYYLQTLSFFSARLKNPQLRSALLEAPDTAAIYALLCKK